MPSNPLEYMPEGLRRQIDKCLSMKKEAQLSGNTNLGVSVNFPPCGLENVSFSMNPLNQVAKDGRLTSSVIAFTLLKSSRRCSCKFYA